MFSSSELEMIKTIITIVSTALTTFVGAFIGARLSHKNIVRQKYYDNRTAVYLELSKIIPPIDEFFSQSDYFGDYGVGGSADSKISVIEARIAATEEILRNVEDANRRSELVTEISNLKYVRNKHLEYLESRKILFAKIVEFREKGHENELRIFGSGNVWMWYLRFKVSLDNEYNTNIGITNDAIDNNMRMLVKSMREDLSKNL